MVFILRFDIAELLIFPTFHVFDFLLHVVDFFLQFIDRIAPIPRFYRVSRCSSFVISVRLGS